MLPIEVWLSRELRRYAIEVRNLAYKLSDGVSEHGLLQSSEQMNAAADQAFETAFASLADDEPDSLETGIGQTTLPESDADDRRPLIRSGGQTPSSAVLQDEGMPLSGAAQTTWIPQPRQATP